MAASQDVSKLTDDEIVALLAQKEAELKAAKEKQASEQSAKQAETKAKAKEEVDASTDTPDWRPNAMTRMLFPKTTPSWSTFFLPLALMYGARDQMSAEQMAFGIFCLTLVVCVPLALPFFHSSCEASSSA